MAAVSGVAYAPGMLRECCTGRSMRPALTIGLAASTLSLLACVSLSGLEAAHYREVLSFSEKIQGLDRKKTNIAVGLFQSALYLLSSAERSGRITPDKTAALLLDFVRAMFVHTMDQPPSPSDRAAYRSPARSMAATASAPAGSSCHPYR